MDPKEKAIIERQKARLMSEVEEINSMTYAKSRKDRAEKLRKELSKVDLICGAIEKATGRICSQPPVEGGTNGRCAKHGGLATGPTSLAGQERALSNLNPKANLIHGLYSRFSMTLEEQTFYEGMMNYYIEALDLDPMNILALDRALRNFILQQRKEVAEAGEMLDESESYNDYDTKFMRWLQTLGLDRKFNVSKDHKDNSQIDLGSLFDMD